MFQTRPVFRTTVLVALALAVLAASGCRWFRKENSLYAGTAETRPLEVPPDLDRPATDGAMALPDVPQSVTRSEAGPGRTQVASTTGFNVSGNRDEIFTRVGEVLGAIPDLQISSSARLLGTYDVSYGGSNFLVRIAQTGDGAYISAVDPRGLPAGGEGPTKLIAALRAELGG
ncbi:hypothetical protein H0E84_02430 [Luteimonas sp. SJ-92]|uniref:Beta-barrel assembly machine subunit BamC n=1 Tax=Luteimonas salinisoli TaxID=2752307 RepID=A0A853J7U6_9GAMM|nr:hypothetical protein [Luteimonas salinisoli]NZA25226.1 hypothetical protein [Luteimonas salinisoli]